MSLDFNKDKTVNVSISLRESTHAKVDTLVTKLQAQQPNNKHRINRSSVIDQIVAEKLENMPCE